MKCEYCGRDGCLAYATENGFPVLAGDDRTIAEIECRNATRERALRAEDDVRALAGCTSGQEYGMALIGRLPTVYKAVIFAGCIIVALNSINGWAILLRLMGVGV